MSVAAGVLATVAITPAIALTSVAANDTIGVFEDLPDYLEIAPLSQRTNVYATHSDGTPELLAYFYSQNRIIVGDDQVSGFVKNAAIAGEDPRFFEHGGVDLQGTLRAILYTYVLDRSVQGGSSITQQYVKNVNVQNAIKDLVDQSEINAAFEEATAPDESRKVREMKYAIGLEKRYSKDEILMGYLNIVGFGGNIYGIEAAAQYYFGTSAANLSLPQSASLLAIVNSPSALKIDNPGSETNGAENGYAENKSRRDYILGKMLEEQMITQQEHDDAVASPVEPNIQQPDYGCSNAGGRGFFCDYVKRTFENDDFFGEDPDERERNFVTSGYDVYTTLNLDLQAEAESAINDNVPMTLPDFDVGASVVTVEPGTGKILAMAQNKVYSENPDVIANDPTRSAINYNANYEYGGSTGFQPGSTYKVFTLLEWLKEGHGINEGVDGRLREWQGTTWQDSCYPSGTYTVGDQYRPLNDELDNPGYITAYESTETSKNSGFLAMAYELDLCGISETAASMGVVRADKGVQDPVYKNGEPVLDEDGNQTYAARSGELYRTPATVLGTNEIAPLQMAEAYATIASGGTYCEPIAIERIVAPDGSEVAVPPVTCTEVLDADIAAAAAYALQNAFENGTGSPTYNRLTTVAPTIGKTGTTDDAKATWMTASTTRATTVTGVFNVTGGVNQRDYYFSSGKASEARHRIAPRVQSAANAIWGGDEFPEPSPELLRGQQVAVPEVYGLSLDQARSVIQSAGFTFQNGGQRDSQLPAGTVTGTNLSGTVPKGSTISVYTSNGALRSVPDVSGQAPAAAAAALASAGFTTPPSTVCTSNPELTGNDERVVGTNPSAGTAARPDTAITLATEKKTC